MKLKPEFTKGHIYVKHLNKSVNLAVATQKELELLKEAGIDYLFDVEPQEVKREYPVEATEIIEEPKLEKPKNKKK